MRLLLMRHGEAEPPVDDDAGRALTESGRAGVAHVAEQARAWADGAAIISSPFLRARQTAEIVASTWKTPGESVIWDALVPESDVRRVIRKLEESGDAGRAVLLVTHQPLIGHLAQFLTSRSTTIMPATVLVIDMNMIEAGWGNLTCVITA